MKKMNFINRAMLLVSALFIASGSFAQTSFHAWDMTTERPLSGANSQGIACGNLTFTEKDVTFELWLNIASEKFVNGATIFSTRHEGRTGLSLDVSGGKLRAFFRNDYGDKFGTRTDYVFPLFFEKADVVDKWVHLAVVFSSTDNIARSYLNGEVYEDIVKSEDPYTPYEIGWVGNFKDENNVNNVGGLRLGYWYETATPLLYGKIADFRIWSVGRTDEEIKANYNKNLTGTYEDNPGLYINYRFASAERGFKNDANPTVATNTGWCNPSDGWQNYYKRETLSAIPQNLAIADETLSWTTSAGEWEVSVFKKDDNSNVFTGLVDANSVVLNKLNELESDINYYAKVRTLNNGVWSGQVTSEDFTVTKIITGLNETESDSNIAFYVKDGSLIVNVEKPQTLNIYTASGQLVRSLNLVAGENVIGGLAKGFYLANNQKIVIR